MKEIITLALRNLTRQKRRSVILAIAIAFGFFVVTAIDGLASGAVENLRRQLTQLVGGTVLIQGLEKLPPENEKDKGQLVNIIRDHDYIRNVVEDLHINYETLSQYSMMSGTILFNGKKALANVTGRDLINDKDLLDSLQIVSGSKENFAKPKNIIVSETMADTLNIVPGDTVLFTTSTIYGQNTVGEFTVSAVIKGNSFMSGLIAYVDIESLNELIEIPAGGYDTFTIYLKNERESAAVADAIEERIREDGVPVTNRMEAIAANPTNPGTALEKQLTAREQQWEGVKYGVETFDDEVPQLQQVMTIVHMVTYIILIVILLIVMVGISNTYRMILYERIREVGTMRALGMQGKAAGRLFTTEAVILCIIGAIAGLILALVVMSILGTFTIKNEAVSFFLRNGHITYTLSAGAIIAQYILLIVLTALAVRGSAKKAAKMTPAQALRTIK